MIRKLAVVNALLTVPFGIAAFVSPVPVFALFGVHLDGGGELVARGYAATCLGYGLTLWALRAVREPAQARAMVIAMTVFNALEALAQGSAAMQGIAAGGIWVTVGAHAVVTVWCGATLARVWK